MLYPCQYVHKNTYLHGFLFEPIVANLYQSILNAMKIKYFSLLALAAFSLMTIGSCKKETTEPEPEPVVVPPPPVPAAPAPSNPTPSPSDANGVLAAVKAVSSVYLPVVGNFKQEIGVPVAVFFDVANTYLDAGAVKCNSNDLTKQTNNSYLFTPNASNPTGIDYSSGVSWSVGGNSGTSIPTFTYTVPIPFPTLDSIAGGITKVTRANGVTIAATNTITGADSVIFSVYGPSGNAQKVKAGNVSSYTFTAAELSGIGAGSGYIQIVPYAMTSQTFSGKKYYFINEAAFTKMVNID